MSEFHRTRRRQLIAAAEGYIELLLMFDEDWRDTTTSETLAKRALECLEPLRGARYRRSHIHYLRGQALRAMGKFHEAIEPLSEAVAISPENIHLHLALAWCHKRIGRIDLAIGDLEEALLFEPDKPILHYNLACYWSLAKEPTLALEYLAQALQFDAGYRDLIQHERDFDAIRFSPGFLQLSFGAAA